MAEVKTRKVIHMVRRGGISKTKAWAIRLLAAALSLLVCAFVIVGITGQNPVAVYAGIISGAVGSGRRAWVTIREMVTLLVIAVGLTPAFNVLCCGKIPKAPIMSVSSTREQRPAGYRLLRGRIT